MNHNRLYRLNMFQDRHLDVSRWGRFQNVDEGAYYEFLCSRSGIEVHYANEQFGAAETPYASILKTLKRVMAAEYSRELSMRVVRGQRLLAAKGFHLGGATPYGLRRVLIGEDGQAKRQLQSGERKSAQAEKIRLIPGPKKEQAVINWIYDKFLEADTGELEITRLLNRRRIVAKDGKAWTREQVCKLLKNEKYIGNMVTFKVSARLGAKIAPNNPEIWVRAENAILPIVSLEKFKAVQQKLAKRRENLRSSRTNEELLSILKEACRKLGKISYAILAAHPELPSLSTYQSRFGNMSRVYELIGYKQKYDTPGRTRKKRRFKKIAYACSKAYTRLLKGNKKDFCWLSIHPFPIVGTSRCRISFVISASYPTIYRGGPSFWRCNIGTRAKNSDFVIILQLDETSFFVQYYYLIRATEVCSRRLVISEKMKTHRFKSLAAVYKKISSLSKNMPAIDASAGVRGPLNGNASAIGPAAGG